VLSGNKAVRNAIHKQLLICKGEYIGALGLAALDWYRSSDPDRRELVCDYIWQIICSVKSRHSLVPMGPVQALEVLAVCLAADQGWLEAHGKN
jgi:hypothetical protein